MQCVAGREAVWRKSEECLWCLFLISQIRPNVPAVTLCCCWDNYTWANKKWVGEMLRNTLRKSNSGPKQDIYTSCLYKTLWDLMRENVGRVVCASAGSLFVIVSPNLKLQLCDILSIVTTTTQEAKNTFICHQIAAATIYCPGSVTPDSSVDVLTLLLHDWNLSIHMY